MLSFQDFSISVGLSTSSPLEPLTTVFLSVPPSILSPTGTAPSILATIATTAADASATISPRPGAQNGECKLLGPFALFIQGALGLLALSSLVYKRWRERPQRPMKIWAFDASKQVVGSALLHIANLLMSLVSSGELTTITASDYAANPCSFYLLNLAIDTTLGIPILIVLLRLLTYAFSLTPFGRPLESIQSGNYGQPPRYRWFLKQCFVYFIGLLGMKLCVFLIFRICPWMVLIGDWALRWTEGDERLQVFFVMLFFPLIMNALQYYIIDGFIKKQTPTGCEAIASEIRDDESDSGETAHAEQERTERSGEDTEEALLTQNDADLRGSRREDELSTVGDAKALEALQDYSPGRDGAESSISGVPLTSGDYKLR